jgi:hypothetical protein
VLDCCGVVDWGEVAPSRSLLRRSAMLIVFEEAAELPLSKPRRDENASEFATVLLCCCLVVAFSEAAGIDLEAGAMGFV